MESHVSSELQCLCRQARTIKNAGGFYFIFSYFAHFISLDTKLPVLKLLIAKENPSGLWLFVIATMRDKSVDTLP